MIKSNSLLNLNPLIKDCLNHERSRELSERSIKEIKSHLEKLSCFCKKKYIRKYKEITFSFLKDFLLTYNPKGSASLGKALVWTLRKFFAYLVLLQYITDNPAKTLSHPKIVKREKLPEYLKPEELRIMLDTAANINIREITILSLLTTVGARPHEIAKLKVNDIFVEQQYILLSVKGQWWKRTPISSTMADLFKQYFLEYPNNKEYAFMNNWNNPIDKHWILRTVKHIGKKAGIKRNLSSRMMRHTFATYAADRHGFVITRALLGHCKISHSTDVYMHLIPSKFRKLMNAHPYQVTIRRGK